VLGPASTRGPVPAAWAHATFRAAMRISSGQATALATSTRVASRVEGVIATLLLAKLKVALEAALAFGLIGVGASVFARNLWGAIDDQSPATEILTKPTLPIGQVTDPKELVSRITDHIKDNYARLRTVRAVLQTTNLDRSVTKREEVTNEFPNGLRVHFVREPSSVRRERVLLSGEDLLREATDEDGEIWLFQGGVYTQYVPRAKTAWLRLPAQMPGIFPLDPRNIASMEHRSLFIDKLRGDRVLEIGPSLTLDGQPRMAALMEHTFDQGHKERYRCEFDTARNDLPTRIVDFRDEDKIGIVLDITYQEVIPGTTWFLKKATLKFFGQDPPRSPDSEAWRQAMIVETMGQVLVNRPIPADVFVVRTPEGTRFSDAVHSSHD
jgi:hypothetical protein